MGDKNRVISAAELAKHASPGDLWVSVDGVVMDVTKFVKVHPGGAKVLERECGKDASKKFKMFHKPAVLVKYAKRLQIGVLEGSAAAAAAAGTSGAAGGAAAGAAAISAAPFQARPRALDVRRFEPFGNQQPFAEPAYLSGAPTTYYHEGHVEWRKRCRAFFDAELAPNVHEWDEAYEVPKEFYAKMYAAGLLPGVVGPWPSEYVDAPCPPGWDMMHEAILIDELSRCGSGGAIWAIMGGVSIGLPVVLQHGSAEMKRRVAGPCLRGEKFICLAITEPGAGSDVAGLQATARKTADGKHYIVNGEKKWITNGVFSDYFTVLVRTGGDGGGGLSFLLLERGMPGLETKHMKCMGVWASGTTYITMEDVKVPAANLIGREGKGFIYAMHNFSHERWSLCVQAQRLARVCLEEAFAYSLRRKTFGKDLCEHQVIRAKLAEMARRVESSQAWLDEVTFQYAAMPHAEANAKLGPAIALLKAHTSDVFRYCATEAAQVFGGASYVRGGAGEKVARLYREVIAYMIPGGSYEILEDFAVRQSIKQARKAKL